jgi:sulfatase maturation enzyme AslB (radical SAM superfamily)
MAALTLKEVIWETSLKCNKNCSFCGTKEIDRNGTVDSACIVGIANKIAEYPPEELVLSGGEPGLLSSVELSSIFQAFNGLNTKFKVISNGTILDHKEAVLDRFERIGISVNTAKEIDDIVKHSNFQRVINKITFVTNFGKHNIWDFDPMFTSISSLSCMKIMWQVQLTQGNDFMLPPEGIKHLRKQISLLNKNFIVQADNLRENNVCAAGISSCGVLRNGDVVPCLSQRCWNENIDVQGNVFARSFEDIWKNGFEEQRFGTAKHCRDCINFPDCKKVPEGFTITKEDDGIKWAPIYPKTPPQQPMEVVMYGVFTPPLNPPTYVYGVTNWPDAQPIYGCVSPQVDVYGVFNGPTTNKNPVLPFKTILKFNNGTDSDARV